MAAIDTTLDTVKGALGDVTELASQGLETAASALSELAEERRSRKGLVLLFLLILAIIGVVAWKKMSSRGESAEGSGEPFGSPATSASA